MPERNIVEDIKFARNHQNPTVWKRAGAGRFTGRGPDMLNIQKAANGDYCTTSAINVGDGQVLCG